MIEAIFIPHDPLVRVVDGYYFEFLHDGRVVYDLSPSDAGDALRWIEHIANKSWVTKAHILQFAKLAADHFGARYR